MESGCGYSSRALLRRGCRGSYPRWGDRYAKDLSATWHQAYGPRVGVTRILKLLAAHDIEATFFVPGVTAERWPGTVEEILQAGHGVALHGHSHRVPPGMSVPEQRRDLETA